MDPLSQIARQLRIPRPVVKDATTALLLLLQRFARPEEIVRLGRELPLARELLGEPQGPRPAIVTWVSGIMALVSTGPRSISESLRATGLREAEVVPFASAFVQQLRAEVDPEFVAQLIGRVPGLSRLSAMPHAHQAEQ